jgi:hypothetical protein
LFFGLWAFPGVWVLLFEVLAFYTQYSTLNLH